MTVAAEKMSNEQSFVNQFADFEKQLGAGKEGLSERLSIFRRSNLERFESLGFPTRKTEEWKYTQITPYLKNGFALPKASAKTLPSEATEAFAGAAMTFMNGRLVDAKGLDALKSQGVYLFCLSDLVQKGFDLFEGHFDEDQFLKYLDHFSLERDDVFRALNGAFVNEGYVLWIKPGAHVEKPIQITFASAVEAEAFAQYPRNMIVVGRGAQVSLMESFIGLGDGSEYFMNSVTDAFLEENSTLRYSKVQSEGLQSLHVGELRAELQKDAQIDTFNLSLGAKLSRHNLKITECGEGASARVNGLYVAQGKQHVDNRTVIHHAKPLGHSEQLYKGVLTDKARAVFNGKIHIDQYAQQVNSSQLNKNLILGDKAEVDTKPELEIYADDVKANHGATVGQMSEEEIFYIMSRAIPREDAVAMLSRGFVKDVLFKFPDEKVRQYMDEVLTRQLGSLEKSLEG